MKWLRLSILGVAVIAFICGSVVPFEDYVMMYFYITASIYGAGAGAAIIGGLYWKKGTTSAAWGALITGAVLSAGGLAVKIIWPNITALQEISPEFPLNGMHMTIIAAAFSALVYVVVSVCGSEKDFDLDSILHRGKHSIEGEHVVEDIKIGWWGKVTGVDKEFTVGDKLIANLSIIWVLGWFVTVLLGAFCYWIFKDSFSDKVWMVFWKVYFVAHLIAGVVVFIWYLIGGLVDVRKLFRSLTLSKRDESDNGSVERSV